MPAAMDRASHERVMHLTFEWHTQQRPNIAGMKPFRIDAVAVEPTAQFQKGRTGGQIFQAIEAHILVQHPFVMAEGCDRAAISKGDKAAIGGVEIHSLFCQAGIGDAGEVLEIVR